jgi:hypothetical protein
MSEINTPASTSTSTTATRNEKVLVALADEIKNYNADELRDFTKAGPKD